MPTPAIALRFESPLELLVSVMLSAQTTDVNVNRVTGPLFREVPPPGGLPRRAGRRSSSATSSRPASTGRRRRSLRGTMRILIEEHDGEVPTDFDALLRLPGVARKTANVVSAERGARAGDRRRHARPAALAAARLHAAGGPGEDRARPDAARAARGLGPLPAPADLARPPGLRRAPARLRALRRSPTSARRAGSSVGYAGVRRDEQPAVVVVGGEEVAVDLLLDARRASAARAAARACGRPIRAPSRSAAGRRARAPRRRRGPSRSASLNPVSSKTPSPVASTRPSWSQTMNPVACAG